MSPLLIWLTISVFFDGDYLSIRGDPPLQPGSMPILIMPDYKRVLSELPNVPFDERGAYLRARMVIVNYWNRWVAANGGLIRGNRLLLSCRVVETSGGRSARDSLFVFNLKDLPTLPLQGRPSVPSLVPVMVDRGVAYPVEEGENAPPRGQWLTQYVEMDPTAIYRIMVKSIPTHGTLNYRECECEYHGPLTDAKTSLRRFVSTAQSPSRHEAYSTFSAHGIALL